MVFELTLTRRVGNWPPLLVLRSVFKQCSNFNLKKGVSDYRALTEKHVSYLQFKTITFVSAIQYLHSSPYLNTVSCLMLYNLTRSHLQSAIQYVINILYIVSSL